MCPAGQAKAPFTGFIHKGLMSPDPPLDFRTPYLPPRFFPLKIVHGGKKRPIKKSRLSSHYGPKTWETLGGKISLPAIFCLPANLPF